MRFGRHWLFLIYVGVLGLGSLLSIYIYQQGQDVRDEILLLGNQDITRLRVIAELKQAVLAREPILYRYYTDTDRSAYLRAYANNDRRINDGMRWLTATFPEHPDLAALREDQQALQMLAEQLDRVLAPARVDWDEARRILGDVAVVSMSLNNRLDQFVQAVEKQVTERGDIVSRATADMFYSVVAVSVVVFILALFFGHYAYQHLSDARARRLLALFPERNPSPVFRLNAQGKMIYANPAALALHRVIALDMPQADAILPTDLPEKITAMRLKRSALLRFEYSVAKHIFFCTLQYLEDFDTYHVYLQDITARRTAERHNEFLAYHDPLTGLPNRRRLEADAEELFPDISQGAEAIVALVNVDRFRMVSQSLGHLAGDRLISAMAARLNQNLNTLETDAQITLYRLEGDHFVIVAINGDQSLASQLGAQLRQALRAPLFVDKRALSLTLSVGLAYYPDHGKDMVQLLKNAESAMRSISDKGGDGLGVYQPEMNANALLRLELSHELRHAISRQELTLHYQPKVDLHTGSITGAEALVRWNHTRRGLIPPAEFIPLAEETGSINVIGEWILRNACKQNLLWQRSGLSPITIAVNISARQFTHDLPALVAQILRETGLEATWLELEITEGVAMAGVPAIEIMGRLRALGVKLAIDDFGTGFSSLAYLKRFPIQTLKIDQSFVQQMNNHAPDRAIVRATVELGHHLGLDVVAEGVEDATHLALLRQYRCDTMQGYLFSKPVNAEDFSRLLYSGRHFNLSTLPAPT